MFVVVAVFVYPIVYYDWIMENPYTSTPYAIVLGSFVILFALETSRRTIGLVFTALAVIALLYALLGSYLPGTWGHSGFN